MDVRPALCVRGCGRSGSRVSGNCARAGEPRLGWRPRAGPGRVPRSGSDAASTAARCVGRRAVPRLPGCRVPGPRAPAPSLPSPLARSQPQIKHFLPLSSYPAGRAARALPLPAPSLPLAVSQLLCSLRRLGGCEAGAPAPSFAMSPPL